MFLLSFVLVQRRLQEIPPNAVGRLHFQHLEIGLGLANWQEHIQCLRYEELLFSKARIDIRILKGIVEKSSLDT